MGLSTSFLFDTTHRIWPREMEVNTREKAKSSKPVIVQMGPMVMEWPLTVARVQDVLQIRAKIFSGHCTHFRLINQIYKKP